jgi:3,4-dihydroxy 2-butanone 4-phosphate synthase/GTP cyclohydrolase II
VGYLRTKRDRMGHLLEIIEPDAGRAGTGLVDRPRRADEQPG